jgi:hypothetical protein
MGSVSDSYPSWHKSSSFTYRAKYYGVAEVWVSLAELFQLLLIGIRRHKPLLRDRKGI